MESLHDGYELVTDLRSTYVSIMSLCAWICQFTSYIRAFVKHYPSSPPSHLASSVHSMLLSTLLQPSAVFLALWYIVRLPVFFGPVNLDRELHLREICFREELLGEARLTYARDAIESYAPFRLILLGCMLANKWLDDHTFSNKTWWVIKFIPSDVSS